MFYNASVILLFQPLTICVYCELLNKFKCINAGVFDLVCTGVEWSECITMLYFPVKNISLINETSQAIGEETFACVLHW